MFPYKNVPFWAMLHSCGENDVFKSLLFNDICVCDLSTGLMLTIKGPGCKFKLEFHE